MTRQPNPRRPVRREEADGLVTEGCPCDSLDTNDARILHFAELVELVPSLASLADLPVGWWAG
jgi:hypothetical protein